MMSIGDALKIAGQLPKRNYYLRWDEKDYRAGDKLPASRQWRNEEPTGKTLCGTSALDANYSRFTSMDLNHTYYCGTLYLVTGKVVRRGQDAGEVILRDATICKVLHNA